ncbi:MAG TPA: DUF2071 domain-containing protein, partial [Chthoniobacterales bacterium]
LAVVGARTTTGLPYFNAEMSATCGEFIDYACRRSDQPQTAEYRYRGVGEARKTDPESLEFFLLDRYYLFAQRGGALIRAQVSHERYRPRDAEVPAWSGLPARLDGFPEVSDAPVHSCYVDGFDVKVYGTQQLPKRRK